MLALTSQPTLRKIREKAIKSPPFWIQVKGSDFRMGFQSEYNMEIVGRSTFTNTATCVFLKLLNQTIKSRLNSSRYENTCVVGWSQLTLWRWTFLTAVVRCTRSEGRRETKQMERGGRGAFYTPLRALPRLVLSADKLNEVWALRDC